MRIFVMTDLEGVSGVRTWDDWCHPDGRYYDTACRLLTEEVNAVVDGFFAGGATQVVVADGHGLGGIDIERLDPRVDLARGWPEGFPFGLTAEYRGIAWVGQHAKASTPYAHLAHTQWFNYIDLRVNGVSIGEFGQLALCAAELGVPAFFAAGEEAFAREAEALVPGIVTCPVKRGVTPGSGDDCTTDEYRLRNHGAVHIPPPRARAMLRKSAEAALFMIKKAPPRMPALQAPYERVALLRPELAGDPRQVSTERHESSLAALMNMPLAPVLVKHVTS